MKLIQRSSLLFFCFMMVAVVFISGCTSQSASGSSPDPESVILPQISEMVFTETVTSQNADDSEKKIIIEYDIRFPQIDNADEHPSLLLINEYYQMMYRDVMEYGYQQAYNFAKNDYEDAKEVEGYQFMPHGYGVSFEVTNNDNRWLSVVLYEYTYTGGAHPSMYRSSVVFDVRTGEPLSVADFSGQSEEDAMEYVLSEIATQIDTQIRAEDAYYFEDYQDYFRGSLNSQDFYLESGELVFYYQQYAIAPYAAGFPEFRIPLSGMESLR